MQKVRQALDIVPWIDFHQCHNIDAAAITLVDLKIGTYGMVKGIVWDQCTLAESDFEKGFPCLYITKRNLDRGSQNKLVGAIINITS